MTPSSAAPWQVTQSFLQLLTARGLGVGIHAVVD